MMEFAATIFFLCLIGLIAIKILNILGILPNYDDDDDGYETIFEEPKATRDKSPLFDHTGKFMGWLKKD